MTTDDLPESEESLFSLAAPPLVWAAHFLLSYGTAAIYCAKLAGEGGSLAPARIAIAVYTAVALATVTVLGVRGYRRHRTREAAPPPHDDDSPIGRHRFLGFATLLLAGLSALAIGYGGLVVVFLRSCR
jgi:hypothetical protein